MLITLAELLLIATVMIAFPVAAVLARKSSR